MQQATKHSLKQTVRMVCLCGGALLILTQLAYLATNMYESIVPPTDMHLPGLLTAAMMFYVAPAGGILFVVGGLMWVGMSFSGRSSKRERTDAD